MSRKQRIDEVVLASDVLHRDGIGLEAYCDGELVVEVFRDDEALTRTVTLFQKGVSLEVVEEAIAQFKDRVPWEFVPAPQEIFVALAGEGVDCWRPVQAEPVATGGFMITSEPDDADERWAFAPGSVVRCAEKTFQDGRRGLVAVELVEQE